MENLKNGLRKWGVTRAVVLRPPDGTDAVAMIDLLFESGMVTRNLMVYPFPEQEDSYHLWYPTKDAKEYSPHYGFPLELEELLLMLAWTVIKNEAFDVEGIKMDRPRLYHRSDLTSAYRRMMMGLVKN